MKSRKLTAGPSQRHRRIGATVSLLTALLGCKTTSPAQSSVKSDWESQEPNGEGIFVIDWSCGIRQGPDGLGIMQDEYCEWDRKRADQGGNVTRLACDFSTSFDQRRQKWLPMRDGTPEFDHTKNNTNPALVILVRDCAARPGAHCEKTGDPSRMVDCVPDRASDPEVCRQVNAMVHTSKKKISLVPLPTAEGIGPVQLSLSGPAPAPAAAPANDYPWDPRVGIQLGLISPLPDFCKFDVDPKLKAEMLKAGWSEDRIATFAADEKTFVHCEVEGDMLEMYSSCDEISSQLKAGVRVQVKN